MNQKRIYRTTTIKQIKFIRENYMSMTLRDIAEKLDMNAWVVHQNAKKLGLRKHGTGGKRMHEDGYPVIRIAANNWIAEHRHIWEQANGPIPDGMLVVFKDGADRTSPKLEELELLSRSQFMRKLRIAQVEAKKNKTNDPDKKRFCSQRIETHPGNSGNAPKAEGARR